MAQWTICCIYWPRYVCLLGDHHRVSPQIILCAPLGVCPLPAQGMEDFIKLSEKCWLAKPLETVPLTKGTANKCEIKYR